MGLALIFQDRYDAGRRLARHLEKYRHSNPIVLGLPRGGVVVAYEVARALEAPLDVVVARKLGAPFQPELAIGAIAPGGVLVLNENLGIEEADIEQIAAREHAEMERRILLFRGESGFPEVKGRTVILVDDGLATGLTAMAAIEAVRRAGPERIVLAVPVAARETAMHIAQVVDDFICPSIPASFFALGQWYVNFNPVSDEVVVNLLNSARRELPAMKTTDSL